MQVRAIECQRITPKYNYKLRYLDEAMDYVNNILIKRILIKYGRFSTKIGVSSDRIVRILQGA